jgi:hypothetical protein
LEDRRRKPRIGFDIRCNGTQDMGGDSDLSGRTPRADLPAINVTKALKKYEKHLISVNSVGM